MCEADEFRDFRWRTRERDVFRELNKNPFIAYPIKETVNTMAHKASLLLQVALGCVDLSDVPDVVRRQITLDTSLLFERMHRLVRAVIECKASDLDGVTCRVALDLARSMAARAWEGKSMQLTQVAQLGPVFMRKFVASGITTVRDLVEAGASNIERIVSRNPPFGKKMADELAHFPRLTLEARVATENPRGFKPGMQPMIRVDAALGFSNTFGTPKWRGKIPSVTFMAETTEGFLAHFWRGSMKKFKEEDKHKLFLQFELELSSVFEEIICHFACEDIVGTVVTRKLKHHLPASAFSTTEESTSQFSRTSDHAVASLMDDEIGDNDLLEISQGAGDYAGAPFEQLGDSKIGTRKASKDTCSRNCVDDLVPSQEDDPAPSQDSEKETMAWHPIQLPNGKFKCNHRCADFGLKNGNGKACAHRCCREGLDAPRKPKPSTLKRKTGNEEIVVSEPASKLSSKPATKKVKTTIAKDEPPSRSSSRKPLISTSANRKALPLMDLDDFDLDGDGLIDLTQVEGAHVDDFQVPRRSPFRVKKHTGKAGLHDEEISLFDDLSDDSLRNDLGPRIGKKTKAKDHTLNVGTKTNPLHAGCVETRSNSTNDFSGDSVFDGVAMDECKEQQSRSYSGVESTASASRDRPRYRGDVSLHEKPEAGFSLAKESSDTPAPGMRSLDQLNAASRDEEALRADFTRPSPRRSGMLSKVGQARFTSPTICPSTHDLPSQQASLINSETKESEDETYIFSENYMLPPPRDSFGEDGVIFRHVSNEEHLPHDPDMRAFHKPAELASSSPKDNEQLMKSQDDSEWQGFEPGFTNEFRDLVEFI